MTDKKIVLRSEYSCHLMLTGPKENIPGTYKIGSPVTVDGTTYACIGFGLNELDKDLVDIYLNKVV